jgi:hypothetical protein
MWGKTVAIHGVLKKNSTKLNSQPAQYKKKINKDNFGKKSYKQIEKMIKNKRKRKKIKKKSCRETL